MSPKTKNKVNPIKHIQMGSYAIGLPMPKNDEPFISFRIDSLFVFEAEGYSKLRGGARMKLLKFATGVG